MVDKRKSIIRKQSTRHFTITPNEVAQNPNLTHGAKGLLLQMLSYPDDWGFNLKHLSSKSASGMHATRSCFKELEDAGFVTRTVERDDRGRVTGYLYTVFDTPTSVGFSDLRGTDLSKPDLSKPHATNTKLTKTNQQKDQEQKHVEKAKTEIVPSMSAAPTSASNEALLNLWNEHCDPLPKVTRLNGKRSSALNQLRRELGVEVEEIFCAAVLQVAGDAYWVENGYGFDNLLRNGRVLEKAEKYKAHGRSTSGQRRMVTTAMRIAAAIGGTDA